MLTIALRIKFRGNFGESQRETEKRPWALTHMVPPTSHIHTHRASHHTKRDVCVCDVCEREKGESDLVAEGEGPPLVSPRCKPKEAKRRGTKQRVSSSFRESIRRFCRLSLSLSLLSTEREREIEREEKEKGKRKKREREGEKEVEREEAEV